MNFRLFRTKSLYEDGMPSLSERETSQRAEGKQRDGGPIASIGVNIGRERRRERVEEMRGGERSEAAYKLHSQFS